MRKWSVDEFYGLVRHQLTDTQGPVELVAGKIKPLSEGVPLTQHIKVLRQQLQQYFVRHRIEDFEVRSHYPIQIDNYSALRPTLAIVNVAQSEPQAHWVLDMRDDVSDCDVRRQLYEQCAIAEYWHLSMTQMELRIWSALSGGCYQHERLVMAGETAALSVFPQVQLRLQEPLPLYFLTRTARGQKTYAGTMLPLQIC